MLDCLPCVGRDPTRKRRGALNLQQCPAEQAGLVPGMRGALERALKLSPSLLGEDTANRLLRTKKWGNVTSGCCF